VQRGGQAPALCTKIAAWSADSLRYMYLQMQMPCESGPWPGPWPVARQWPSHGPDGLLPWPCGHRGAWRPPAGTGHGHGPPWPVARARGRQRQSELRLRLRLVGLRGLRPAASREFPVPGAGAPCTACPPSLIITQCPVPVAVPVPSAPSASAQCPVPSPQRAPPSPAPSALHAVARRARGAAAPAPAQLRVALRTNLISLVGDWRG
jgi:hypothetical protein